jgi:hypothetical protein
MFIQKFFFNLAQSIAIKATITESKLILAKL